MSIILLRKLAILTSKKEAESTGCLLGCVNVQKVSKIMIRPLSKLGHGLWNQFKFLWERAPLRSENSDVYMK